MVMSRGVQLPDLFESLPAEEAQREFLHELKRYVRCVYSFWSAKDLQRLLCNPDLKLCQVNVRGEPVCSTLFFSCQYRLRVEPVIAA